MTALMGLPAKLRLARTLVRIDARHEDVTGFPAALFAAGADMVEVRDPTASLERLRRVLETAQRVAMPLNKLVAVGGDLEVARAVMADVLVAGAHVDPALAHARLHEYALVGAPAFTAQDCRHLSESADVDFVMLGRPEGPGPRDVSLDLVEAAADAMPVAEVLGTPWFVPCDLGGEALPGLLAAGARRVVLDVRTDADLAGLRHVAGLLHRAWQEDPALEDFAFRVLSNPGPPAQFRSPTEPTTW